MFIFPDDDDDAHPERVLKRLYETHEELRTIRDLNPDVAVLFREGEWFRGGRCILGMCYLLKPNGDISLLGAQLLREKLGFDPTFLIVLSKDWWDEARPEIGDTYAFPWTCRTC